MTSRSDWTPTPGAVAFGAVVDVLATMLLARTLRPTFETRRYAKDIHGGTEGMRGNLEALAALDDTQERVTGLLRAVEQAAGAPS